MNSRRDFLQKIAGSAFAFTLLPSFSRTMSLPFSDQPSYDGPVLRVAIMGLGSYGTRVSEAMKDCQKAKLAGIISGTPAKIKAWQTKYGIAVKNCYNYENFDQIRDNPDIDAVYVITPNALHHDQVIRVAKAGKHVICEKPMALNGKEAMNMTAACKAAGVRLLVGYRLHFEPNTLALIRMRQEGRFGKILFFQGLSGFTIGDPTQWRLNPKLSGGGALMDIGIYSVNGSRYMTGEEPIWVTAEETKNDPQKFIKGVDETIQFQLGFPSGAVASCLSTYSMNNLDRFFLNGTSGYAEMFPATGYGPIRARTHEGDLNIIPVNHQTVQMDEMAAIIMENKQPVIPIDGEEAVKDLKIIDAIYQAARTGRKLRLS